MYTGWEPASGQTRGDRRELARELEITWIEGRTQSGLRHVFKRSVLLYRH